MVEADPWRNLRLRMFAGSGVRLGCCLPVLACYVCESLLVRHDMTVDRLYRHNHQRHEFLGRIQPVDSRVKLSPNLCF